MEKKRPNPDQLLVQVQKSEAIAQRGKLRIYLGAAPGVGKTYTMLKDALEKKKEGADIVIGIVESHGRQEILAMVKDFENLPRKTQEYRGKQLSEFDLDLALQRKPAIILMDEMAHTNIPGLRHDKRWQDIKEILDAGIDVYTTLNVQHVESLNDVIAQIVQVNVRETVPDYMLEEADTLELVDLSPEDLLGRLHEGKVYFPEQAEIAKEHFFKEGNLIALRELALRMAAKYVGTKVFLYRQDQGINRILPTKEKILACIGHDSDGGKIIRTARRIAESLGTEWFVVYVDSPKTIPTSQQRNYIVKQLHLAEQLGAKTHILTGIDIVEEIMTFAREQNVTEIVIGKKVLPRWKSLFYRSLADEIIRYSGEIDVLVITEEFGTSQISVPERNKKNIAWHAYVIAVGVIAMATGINYLLYPWLNASDLMMVYVLASAAVAFRGVRGPATFASMLGVLAYDFCFVPPFYSFTVANTQYLVTLMVMLFVTQTISHLAVFARHQSEVAHTAERNISALYSLSHQLARTRGVQSLMQIGTKYIAQAFNCEAMIILAEKGRLNDNEDITHKEKSIAQWVYDLKQKAGLGTDTLTVSEALFLPLIASQEVMGVLRIRPLNKERLYTPEEMRLLESNANQIALALEVDKLAGFK